MIEILESELQLRSQDNVTYRVSLWAQDLLLYREAAFGTSGLFYIPCCLLKIIEPWNGRMVELEGTSQLHHLTRCCGLA